MSNAVKADEEIFTLPDAEFQKLFRFTEEDLIKEGAEGRVFKAMNVKKNAHTALKIIVVETSEVESIKE